jgi:hypothetical protein
MASLPSRSLLHAPACPAPKQKVTFGSRSPLIAPEPQNVIGRAADARALQTYLDAEAVLHACERLQAHLKAQDLAIRHIVEHMEECRPKERPAGRAE